MRRWQMWLAVALIGLGFAGVGPVEARGAGGPAPFLPRAAVRRGGRSLERPFFRRQTVSSRAGREPQRDRSGGSNAARYTSGCR